MSKGIKLVTVALVLTIILTLGLVGAAFADSPDNSGPGPAPNSGDGIPDGPDRWGDERPDGSGPGPAPGSGDGIDDGPGW